MKRLLISFRLTWPLSPPQQHPFFTSHEAKETDVASFVKVILGDWVLHAPGTEGGKPKNPSYKKAGLPLTPLHASRVRTRKTSGWSRTRRRLPCEVAGGAGETSSIMWNNSKCLYAKPPPVIRLASPTTPNIINELATPSTIVVKLLFSHWKKGRSYKKKDG